LHGKKNSALILLPSNLVTVSLFPRLVTVPSFLNLSIALSIVIPFAHVWLPPSVIFSAPIIVLPFVAQSFLSVTHTRQEEYRTNRPQYQYCSGHFVQQK